MRIGIDVSTLLHPEVVGTRHYLTSLVQALIAASAEDEFVFFQHAAAPVEAECHLREILGVDAQIASAPSWARALPYAAWWGPRNPPLRWLLRERVDVFHTGDFLFPSSRATPLVGTLFDLTPELFPELHVLPNRVRHRRQMAWAARHATRLIAISQATADDFRRLFPSRVPIDVVHPGVRELPRDGVSPERIAAVRQRRHLGDARVVLNVGTVEPRKNLPRLVQAFEQIATGANRRPGSVRLVIAGRQGWRSEPAYAAAAASSVAGCIHFADDVDDAELAALYATAEVFAYPSLYEGFGLPVVEAMRAGLPVVTSRVSSLPEAAGEAALLIDPTEPADIAIAIDRLLADAELRERLRTAGCAHAARLTWAAAARRTLLTYRAAVASHEACS